LYFNFLSLLYIIKSSFSLNMVRDFPDLGRSEVAFTAWLARRIISSTSLYYCVFRKEDNQPERITILMLLVRTQRSELEFYRKRVRNV
jgi:hypothetical protein